MTELWLEFTNDDGEPERILVDREKFVIGRHSGSDLCISNSVVSRQHISIERFGDVFVVSDCGSSFGSSVNGAKLDEPVGFKNGDVLLLGNEVEFKVELISESINSEVAAPAPAQSALTSGGSSSIPTSFFYIAPVFALLILVCTGGGLFIAFSGNTDSGDRTQTEDRIETREDEDRSTRKEKEKTETKSSPADSPDNEVVANQTPQIVELPPTPKTSSQSGSIEQISPVFLRKIVRNDPSAFLSSKQIEILTPKINQFKSSSALSSNIKDAKANSSQISALAGSTNLTPQFLATAALAKLGNQRGNVVDTAKSMVEVLEKLNRSIGVETADEAMLVIAAYNQGVAGQFTQLRNAVEGLSSKTQGVTARQVRTIWFLHDQKRLTESEFEFALRFLAIGTITQKPSDFNVNAEALNF